MHPNKVRATVRRNAVRRFFILAVYHTGGPRAA
jgi:hypothetical protein